MQIFYSPFLYPIFINHSALGMKGATSMTAKKSIGWFSKNLVRKPNLPPTRKRIRRKRRPIKYTTCTFHEIALTFVVSWFELQEYLKLKYPNIEASGDPTFDFGKDKFKMLEAAKTRIEAVPTENAKPNSKGGQVGSFKNSELCFLWITGFSHWI